MTDETTIEFRRQGQPQSPPPNLGAPPPVDDRRHAVPLWLFLIAVLSFIGGCWLLYMQDGSEVRSTMLPLGPRSEAPAPASSSHTAAMSLPAAHGSPTPAALSAPSFDPVFLDGLRHEADALGIQPSTFDQAFSLAGGPDPSVLSLNAQQPEFERTVGDYVTSLVSPDRVAGGLHMATILAPQLADIERRFGVDRAILVAIAGVESNYGPEQGNRSVIRSLATLASGDPRRSPTWRKELLAALTILEREHMAPEKLVGSWAGAIGQTQLMPTEYLTLAVDYDGDGKRDVWSSAPDALASTANHLHGKGWIAGRPWGREVRLPADFDYAFASETEARPLTGWAQIGIKVISGAWPADDGSKWSLIVPAGANGPAFLVSTNFDALLAYNPAVSYALAVGMLADRIGGGQGIEAAWPAGDRAMSRAERVELQQLLKTVGFDPGPTDGIIGTDTRGAIRAYQKSRGLPADAHPSLALLQRLRPSLPL